MFIAFFYSRLFENTKFVEGSSCVANTLYQHYLTHHSHENAVSETSFKRIVSGVLNITTAQTRYNNEIYYVYRGLKYEPCLVVPFTADQSLPPGFFYISKSDNVCTIGVKTGVYRNGIEVMIEVHIDKDDNVSVQVANAVIVPNQLGLPSNLTKCNLTLCEYLAKLQLCHLCMGKVCVESRPGCQLYMQDGGLHYGIHSKSCFGLLTLLSTGYTCTRCHSIQLLNDDEKPTQPPLTISMEDMQPRRRLQVQSVYSSHKWKTIWFRGPPAFPITRLYHLMSNGKNIWKSFSPMLIPHWKHSWHVSQGVAGI